MSDAAIHNERQKVYGDWRPNMAGTSLQIDGLRVQYEANNPGAPLPAWWAPLCLVATKLNRIASGNYHEDNFVDLRVYLGFVEQMQAGAEIPTEPADDYLEIKVPSYTPPDVPLLPKFVWGGACRQAKDGELYAYIKGDSILRDRDGFAVVRRAKCMTTVPVHIVAAKGGAA